MAGFSNSEFIDKKTPAEVFNFMIDPKNAPKIIPEVRSSVKITEGEIGLGTRFLETRIVRGKEGRAELEITKFSENSAYSVTSIEGGVKVTYHYKLKQDNDGTSVSFEAEVIAKGIKKAIVPLFVRILKSQDYNYLSVVKKVMEEETT
jgi:carbon monoxide dehydrogenase subunit G